MSRLGLASQIAKRYPEIYTSLRQEVKEKSWEYVTGLVKHLAKYEPRLASIRRSEYITEYAVTEFRRRYPELYKALKMEVIR